MVLQVSLNDSHNQMVVHWAGEKSNVIVALARDSLSLLGPKNSDVSNATRCCPRVPALLLYQARRHCGASPLQVYVSYDYGKSFKKISERFSFSTGNSSEVAIAQFYHSPADNKRVRRLQGKATLLPPTAETRMVLGAMVAVPIAV